MRKRKGPGEESEMVEDDEVGEEIENETKRRGSECTSAHLSALSTDSEVNEVLGRRVRQRRSLETVEGPLSKMKVINKRLTTTLVELFKVPGALVKGSTSS